MYDYELIKSNLKTEYIGHTFVQFEDLKSTHQKSKAIIDGCPDGMLVMSGFQDDFKFNSKKWWLCNGIDGIYFSIILKNKKDYGNMPMYIAQAAVCNCIKSLDNNIMCKLKWPNDIYIDRKKLGAIYYENIKGKFHTGSIVSFFINLKFQRDIYVEHFDEENTFNIIDKMIALREFLDENIKVEYIISQILNNFEEYYNELLINGCMKKASKIICENNILEKKLIGIKRNNKKTIKQLRVVGFDDKGEVILEDKNGCKEMLLYGQDKIDWWKDE